MTWVHHQVAFRVNEVNTCGQKTSLRVFISFAQDVIVAVNLCHVSTLFGGKLEQDMKSPPFGGFSILTTYKGKGIEPMEGREGADELQPN